MKAGQHRIVTAVLPCDPMTAYELVSDVVATARHSAEVVSIGWDHRAAPPTICIGDVFTARTSGMGLSWTSTSTVTAADPGHCFAFAGGGTEHPTARWTFLLIADVPSGGTLVSYSVELGDGPSMFDAVSGGDPVRRAGMVEQRLDGLAAGMQTLLSALSDKRLHAAANHRRLGHDQERQTVVPRPPAAPDHGRWRAAEPTAPHRATGRQACPPP